MWIIIILLVLVLGYIDAQKTPVTQRKLKRSTNWESYAILGKHGILSSVKILISSCLDYIILRFLFWSIFWIATPYFSNTRPKYFSFFSFLFLNDEFKFLDYTFYYNILFFIIIFLFNIYLFINPPIEFIKNPDPDEVYEKLMGLDAILDVILQAHKSQMLIRVSLKSRKVYMGIIDEEQFEKTDVDNIVLIPYSSGYRDKDTLKLTWETDYVQVYKKRGIISENNKIQNIHDLQKFRCVIKVSEVESISLYQIPNLDEFNQSPKLIIIESKSKNYFQK